MITMTHLNILRNLKHSLDKLAEIDFYNQVEAICLEYGVESLTVTLEFMDGEIDSYEIISSIGENDDFDSDIITIYEENGYFNDFTYVKGENPYKEIEQELVKIANIYDSFN